MKMCGARFAWVLPLIVAVVATACTNSNPAQPSGPSTVVNALTASVTAPRPLQPANSSQVQYANQPVTLTVQNAVVTRTSGTTYTFEVATDAGFANKAQIKDGVAEGSGGQTSVKVDALAALTDYYWHARATGGGTAGPFGQTYKFTVGPPITIGAPVPIGPLTGAQTGPRPALRVIDATRQGPAGTITYKFEIARDSAFNSIVVTATQAEGVNETGFIPTSDVPINVTLYWRATAIDAANGVASAPSAVQSFTAIPSQAELIAAQLGVALWPGVQPPGATGHAVLGDNWQIQILHHLPTDAFFQSPTVEMLRFFDLFDRGMDPQSAIDWMNGHGYPTAAQWYPPPEKAVLGLQYVYLAARGKVVVNGTWDVVLKTE